MQKLVGDPAGGGGRRHVLAKECVFTVGKGRERGQGCPEPLFQNRVRGVEGREQQGFCYPHPSINSPSGVGAPYTVDPALWGWVWGKGREHEKTFRKQHCFGAAQEPQLMALHTEQLLKSLGCRTWGPPRQVLFFSLRSRSVASVLATWGAREPGPARQASHAPGRVPEGQAHTIRFLSPRHRIFLKARRKSWLKMV